MTNPLARDLDHVLANSADLWDALRGKTIFMTGGTGFVGTWLVESFAWANRRLNLHATAVLLTRDPDAFSRKVLAASEPCIRLLKGDARSFEWPAGDYPFIIHASTDQISPSIEEPGGTFDRELNATRRVLEFAHAHGTRRFLFTSSGAVYGKQPSNLTHVPEEYVGAPSPTDVNSTYGHAKRASELLCTLYAQQFGFTAVLGRLFAFAGPYLPLDSNFAIGNFMRDVIAGGPIHIGGDGTPFRSYLYAADLAVWLWTLLLRGESSRPYNVGSSHAVNIADLAAAVAANTIPGTQVKIARDPLPEQLPSRYVPSVDRVRQELGLSPLIPLDEQIRRMYEWNCKSIRNSA